MISPETIQSVIQGANDELVRLANENKKLKEENKQLKDRVQYMESMISDLEAKAANCRGSY